MDSRSSSPIRISCPQCGGKVKLPTVQAGERYRCSRCGADIVVGQPPGSSDAADEQASTSAPVADAETLRPLPSGSSLDDDEFGITCQVCRTRLHVHPTQIGTTIRCPDCYSPVTVEAPPKRVQPWQATKGTWDDANSLLDGPSAMEVDTERRLEKAKAEQEQEEAEERESSPERFTTGLLAFFADRHAILRLVVLAMWFELAVTIFHCATGILGEAASLAATVVMGLLLLTFLYAASACGLALVKDTSAGLRKIEHWPGIDFRAWGRDPFYIVNAGIMAAIPGGVLGAVLAFAGITGSVVLFTAAATFWAMFPPMLLSMFERKSALAPFYGEVWNSIGSRPDPWKLAYLITALVIIAGLFTFFFCLVSGMLLGLILGFPIGLVFAAALVVLIMIYFRTVGRLFCILAGRD